MYWLWMSFLFWVIFCVYYNTQVAFRSSKIKGFGENKAYFFRPKKRWIGQRAKPLWVKKQVLKLKENQPHLGCRQLAAHFNEKFEYTTITVSKSWVNQLLIQHRHQLWLARKRYQEKQCAPSYKNKNWALDTTQLGIENHVLGILDHGTRFCVCLKKIFRLNTWTILGYVFLAVGRFGKPQCIQSDNHPIFHSWLWYLILGVANIKIKHSQPHSPWQNGRIERFFGTLKSTICCFAPEGVPILIDRTLKAFLLYYNHHRPHQALYHQTPAKAWKKMPLAKRKPRQHQQKS